MPRQALTSTRSLIGACCALLAAAMIQPAQAAPARAGLAGTTHITASSPSAALDVRVPRAVVLDGQCYEDKAVEVSGSADAVVVALVPAGGGPPILFGRLPARQGAAKVSNLCGGLNTLEAGNYRLIMMRSAGTAAVTLQLPGLGGKTRLRARTPSSAVLVDLPEVPVYQATRGSAASFGDTQRLTSKGAVAVLGWVDKDVSAVVTMGSCDKKREPTDDELAEALDFAPGCPTGGSSSQLPSPRGAGVDYFASTYSDIDPASWGVGFYYVSQSPAKSAGALATWIPFED